MFAGKYAEPSSGQLCRTFLLIILPRAPHGLLFSWQRYSPLRTPLSSPFISHDAVAVATAEVIPDVGGDFVHRPLARIACGPGNVRCHDQVRDVVCE